MNLSEITKFLRSNIEPIEDNTYGNGYRVSAYLVDGTYLPCVIFRKSSGVVNQAIKRFKDETIGKSIFSRPSGLGYYEIVKNFVAHGNCIDDHFIEKVEVSKFAFPISIVRQIKGETSMGSTGFVVKMRDNKMFSFGTEFYTDFFEMPPGYCGDDASEVINHSYLGKNGELLSHKNSKENDGYYEETVFRSKPFFECFIDNF